MNYSQLTREKSLKLVLKIQKLSLGCVRGLLFNLDLRSLAFWLREDEKVNF